MPEAQLDRFFLRLTLGYSSLAQENQVLKLLQERHPILSLKSCTTPEQVQKLQQVVASIYVEDSVRDYIVRLTQSTRSHSQVQLGASPRGSLALLRASQAWAALENRDYVLPDDVKKLAVVVLAHRLVLRTESQLRGIQAPSIISELLHQVEVGAERKE